MPYMMTGGYGLLGTELSKHVDAYRPTHQELDVLNREQVYEVMMRARPSVVLHLAAYTDVSKAEVNREKAWALNVIGTENVVRAARFTGAKVVYLSTDYVFDGERGGYEPWDPPNPINYYGLTKLAGECVARMAPGALILRTSFKPSAFPHARVAEDMWTSADYVDVIASRILPLLGHSGIYHLGTERKSLVDLVRRRNPDVGVLSRSDVVSVRLPKDTSFGNSVHWDV